MLEVNYLKPRDDEFQDGEFISMVIEGADCGLLLGLHNAWTNEINGRQSVVEFLSQIPLERVWEIHLAGGDNEDGFWLDSHSGEIPAPVINMTRHIIDKLSNLRALIFELSPSYLSVISIDSVRSQLKILRELWKLRTHRPIGTRNLSHTSLSGKILSRNCTSSTEWEETLGSLVGGRVVPGQLAKQLSSDPGINVFRKLVTSSRSSMIVKTFMLTCRLLTVTLLRRIDSCPLRSY